MIVMLPIDKFDRRRDAEHLENNTLNEIQVQECNDQEIELGGYWISYITLSK